MCFKKHPMHLAGMWMFICIRKCVCMCDVSWVLMVLSSQVFHFTTKHAPTIILSINRASIRNFHTLCAPNERQNCRTIIIYISV